MIIIVYPEIYGVHGIARYVQSYLQNYNRSTTQVALITVPGAERSAIPDDIHLIEIPISAGRGGLLLWSLAARRAIRELLKTSGNHTINFQVPPLIPALVSPMPGAGISVVAHTTYYGMSGEYYDFRYFRGQWGRLSTFVKKAMEWIIFRRADRVVALTEQGNAELKWYGRDENVLTVPNGVDLKKFSLPQPETTQFDVLFVGRIEKRKGSRPLVGLCRRLVQDRPGIRIGIVGYGDDLDYVTAEVEPISANVRMLGKRSFDEVKHYYSASLVYASTSYYEGLPGTCLEAMAMGLPAVVWDFPFYSGLVVPDVTGVLVPVDDIRTFSQAILNLLELPEHRSKMGRQAHAHIAGRYDWAILANQVSAAIDTAALSRA